MGFVRRLFTHEHSDYSVVAGADLAGQRAVSITAGGHKPTVGLSAAATRPLGFLEYDAAAGEEGNVITSGVIRNAIAAEAIAAGAEVTVTADGRVTVVNGTAGSVVTAANRIGRLWTASAAAGDEVILEIL